MTSSTPLRLHDTLSATLREFDAPGHQVKLYVCGVTPYDTAHLGHGFTYVSFDVLIRYLHYLGYTVRYIQNVTDIDDPLFEKARQLGISYRDLATQQTERHLADMGALNVLPAEAYPHASREIPEMIEIAEKLVESGRGYAVDGHVYFSIATDPTYGELSKYDRDTMVRLARERGGDPDDPRRRDALDFVLWRPSKDGEPREASPWGEGLPGWHLECSAMALKYLGSPVDIHGGGSDLIFPHHENEIAQSEQATGNRPFARFWLHTGMVHLGGAKMSKSLGNMIFVRDLMNEYGPDAVRLYISRFHYRSDLHYDPNDMKGASAVVGQLVYAALLPGGGTATEFNVAPYRIRFEDRMSDDLDTLGAIAVLRDIAATIESAAHDGRNVEPLQALLRELSAVLGLTLGGSSPRYECC